MTLASLCRRTVTEVDMATSSLGSRRERDGGFLEGSYG